MRLHRLRLQNFRQHADTTVALDLGLTGIVGPNGAGKTTLLEAIAWAMYGTPAARGTRDSIRRRAAPPRSRVEVELDFELGPHRYRVVRSLQAAALYVDADPAPVANSAGSVTERVTRLLGMTREEFFNTYFTGQKELAIMGSMTGPERARFLSKVLGYERLAAAQARLRETRTALKASLQTAETGLVDPATLALEEREADDRMAAAGAAFEAAVARHAAAVQAAAEVAPRWTAMQARREEVQSVESDLRVAEHRAEEARRGFQELDRALAESAAAKARLDELLPQLAEWDALVALRERLDAEAQAFAGRRAVEARAAEIRVQLEDMARRLAELPGPDRLGAVRGDLAAAQEALAATAREAEEQHAAWVRDKQDAETRRQHLLQQHEDTATQLERLRDTGPTVVCPTCGKPLGREYGAVLDDLQARLDEIVLQGKYYRQRIDQLAGVPAALREAREAQEAAEGLVKRLTGEVATLETRAAERDGLEQARAREAQRLAGLEATLAAAPAAYDEERHRAVRRQVAALDPLRVQATRLGVAAERAAALVPKAAEAEQALSREEAGVAALRERLVGLGWAPEAFEASRLEAQQAERERQEAEVGRVRAEAEQAAARAHRAVVAARREERTRRQQEVDRLRAELTLNQELDRAFTDLRNELNASIRPDLSDAASVLVRDLTNGRYSDLELSEDYVPTLYDDGEPKTVISGGEEDIANLALRLAISQMIAERAGQPFSLLVLDEIFGSLDEERRVAVLDLLRGLADRFPQVVLITHIEAVRDGFDRVIRIEYDRERGAATARDESPRAEVPHVAA
jgi:DNA repair protein SbcC/Rad50